MTQIRKAINYTEKATGTYSFGKIEKAVTGTVNKIAIDNYGSVTVQAFNQKLAKARVFDWSFYTTKKHAIHSNDVLTKLITENPSLFPMEF
jgi:hypothetical protein